MRINNGSLVQVRVYGGQVVTRRLVEVRGQIALISTDEECESAAREQREPICIGFPLSDVVKVVERKTQA